MADCITFGRFRLDVRARALYRDGELVPLGPKVVETLLVLASRHAELVTKEELMDALWPQRFVEEGNLTQNVYRLRKALSAGGLHDAIETMPGRGYRFVADLRELQPLRRRRGAWSWFAVAAVCALAVIPFTTRGTTLSPFSQRALRVAQYHLNLRLEAGHARIALAQFQQVIAHDPGSAAGYAGAADAYLSILDDECDSSPQACPRIAQLALTDARRAVSIDSQSVAAHTAVAMALYELRSDDRGAETEFKRAIALDPTYALAHHWYGNLLTVEGRYGEALRQHRIAASLDPTSPATFVWLAKDAFLLRDYRQALQYAHEAQTLGPVHHPTLVLVGLSYERLGRVADARRSFQRLRPVEARALLAALLARRGDAQPALRLLKGIDVQTAVQQGATEATAFAWLALNDRRRANVYLRATPLPNRIEKAFLAQDPRWTWNRTM